MALVVEAHHSLDYQLLVAVMVELKGLQAVLAVMVVVLVGAQQAAVVEPELAILVEVVAAVVMEPLEARDQLRLARPD
jgi:hypothetical protein